VTAAKAAGTSATHLGCGRRPYLDLILIRVLPRACYRRIAPATCANDLPLETVANRLDPMGCGPNVDQAARWRTFKLPAIAALRG
jgi:hypothetical protein